MPILKHSCTVKNQTLEIYRTGKLKPMFLNYNIIDKAFGQVMVGISDFFVVSFIGYFYLFASLQIPARYYFSVFKLLFKYAKL